MTMKLRLKQTINIDEVEVFKPEGHDRKIMFTEESGIIMNYPSMKQFVDREFLQKEMKTEEVYGFIADSIDQIFDGEDVYDNLLLVRKSSARVSRQSYYKTI